MQNRIIKGVVLMAENISYEAMSKSKSLNSFFGKKEDKKEKSVNPAD